MAQGLNFIGQDDFAVGILRGVARDTQQGVGAWRAVNGLLDDDGDVYRRGGTTYYSPDVAPLPLTFIWTGYLNNAYASLLATSQRFYRLGPTHGLEDLGAPGIAYAALPAVIQNKLYLPNGSIYDGASITAGTYIPADCVAACANRLVVAQGNKVRFSKSGDPATFDPTDFHELPDGVVVKAMGAIRDTLLLFTGYGVWTITNMAFDLTDDFGNAQQSLQRQIPEIALWHEAGLAEFQGVYVVPATDRVYLIDAASGPIVISESIPPLYMSYIRAGYRPGGAKVFRGHYFLPILQADNPVALLVCRLTRPVKGRLTYYPWSTFEGYAAGMVAGDSSPTDPPNFLIAHKDGHVVSFTDVFTPSDQRTKDADGTTHTFDLETRDFQTGNGQPNHVRALRLYYTLEGDAEIQAGYSVGDIGQSYQVLVDQGLTYVDVRSIYASYAALKDANAPQGPWLSPDEPLRYWTTLDKLAMRSPGLDPMQWRFALAERTRFIRARYRCTDPAVRLVIHRTEFGVRSAAHRR